MRAVHTSRDRTSRPRNKEVHQVRVHLSRATLPAIILALLLAGCGQSGGVGQSGATPTFAATDPLSLTIQHQTGAQDLAITLRVTNRTRQPAVWDGGCVVPYVVYLRDARGNLVLRWPPAQQGTHCNAITLVTLAPGGAQVFTIVATNHLTDASGATLPSGAYTVRADFTFQTYDGGGGPVIKSAIAALSW
jgi:hypothetical protein